MCHFLVSIFWGSVVYQVVGLNDSFHVASCSGIIISLGNTLGIPDPKTGDRRQKRSKISLWGDKCRWRRGENVWVGWTRAISCPIPSVRVNHPNGQFIVCCPPTAGFMLTTLSPVCHTLFIQYFSPAFLSSILLLYFSDFKNRC